MSKAAEEEHITISAVSHSISKLEAHLGIKLFSRGSKKLMLTKKGKMFFSEVSPLLKRLDAIDRKICESSKIGKETLTLATTHTYLNHCIIPNAKWIQNQFPDLVFKFETTSISGAIDLVHSGEADLGLVIIDGKEPKDILSFPLAQIKEVVATRADSVLVDKTINSQNIRACRFVTLHSDSYSFAFYKNHFRKCGLILDPEIEVRQMDTICHLLRTTSTVGIIYDFLLRQLKKEDSSFREVSLPVEMPPRTLAFIQREDCANKALQSNFLKKFKSILQRMILE